jgi:hypothetical protein
VSARDVIDGGFDEVLLATGVSPRVPAILGRDCNFNGVTPDAPEI